MHPLVHPVQEGRAAGKLVARRHWDSFLFDGNPKPILLSKPQAEEFIYRREAYTNSNDVEFRDPGPEEWRIASRKTYNAWWDAFRAAYKAEIERLINSFIPKAIKGKLDLFCDMVNRIRSGIADGSEAPEDSYGVHLGKVEEEKRTVLTRSQVPRIARHRALVQARSDWKRAIQDKYVHGIKWNSFFVNSQSSHDARGLDFMPRYMDVIDSSGARYSSPNEAQRSGEQKSLEDLWHREWKQAYRDFIGKKLRDFMPPLARKRAFWLCALHNRLEEVKKERYQKPRRAAGSPPS